MEHDPRHPSSVGSPRRISGQRPLVLVVDDDPDIRETLEEALRPQGFEVSSVGNGHEALEWLRSGHRPSVILLDLMMPVMDGWLFRALQRGDPAISDIPVVVISAAPPWYAPIDVPHHVVKPLNVDRVIEKLRMVGAAA